MVNRPNRHKVMLDVASNLSLLATCPKLSVGCVLTDNKHRIIGSGYNGVPSGSVHCIDTPCKHITHNSFCRANHAERNALMSCSDTDKVHHCYVTHSPCFSCVKMLAMTPCSVIYYSHKYVVEYEDVEEFWVKELGRELIHML